MNHCQNTYDAQEPELQISKTTICIIFIFLIIWIIAGILAFTTSLVCFGYKGSNFDKALGLIIASIFGPFYWIFYGANKNYCSIK